MTLLVNGDSVRKGRFEGFHAHWVRNWRTRVSCPRGQLRGYKLGALSMLSVAVMFMGILVSLCGFESVL